MCVCVCDILKPGSVGCQNTASKKKKISLRIVKCRFVTKPTCMSLCDSLALKSVLGSNINIRTSNTIESTMTLQELSIKVYCPTKCKQ